MGTIRTAFNNVGFKVSEGIDNITSTISSVFNNIIGDLQSTAQGLFAGDVVGIDVNQVPQMQAAIKAYVDALEEHLSQMEANASTEDAYKGDYATAVSEFVGAVKQCCYAVISQLLAFSDQLTAIQQSYSDNDSSLKTDISGQADELRQSYQEYSGSGR